MASRITVLLLLVLVAASAVGCGDGNPAAAGNGNSATGAGIEGTVVPASALASVAAFSSGDPVAEVRANSRNGTFRIAGLSAGKYDIVVSAPGYLTDTSVKGIEVATDQTKRIEEVILFKEGTGTISGSVTPAGVEATVSATQMGAVIAETSANANDGSFLLADLPVGVYDLVATARGYAPNRDVKALRVQEAKDTEAPGIVLVESAEQTGEPGAIEGAVQPATALASVAVFLDGDPVAEARTNSRTGEFRFAGLPAGTYDIVVSAPGYLTDASFTGIEVAADQTTWIGEVILFRAGTGTISGTVSPMGVDAVVSATQMDAVIAETAVDAADGSFLLADLPVGVYDLVATARGYAPNRDARALRVIEARDTAAPGIVLVESAEPTGGLTGTVLPAEAEATVVAYLDGLRIGTTTASVQDGRWQMEALPVGTYSLDFLAEGFSPERMDAVVVVADEMADVGTVRLVPPQRAVRGLVTDSVTQAPVAGVAVTVGGREAVTGGDGTYQVSNPAAGSQTIQFRRPFYLSRFEVVVVPAEGTVERSVSVVATGRIDGTVTDAGGSPLGGVTVSAGSARSGTADDGSFHLTNLLPGAYQVRAAKDGYAESVEEASVEPGIVARIAISLSPAGSIAGQVLSVAADGTRSPLAGATVRADRQLVQSDQAGRFRLDGVRAGSQDVSASAPGHEAAVVQATVQVGAVVAADLGLAQLPRVRIIGTITAREGGAPVGGVTVYAGTGYSMSGISDAQGHYSIPRSVNDPGVPIDTTVLRVSGGQLPGKQMNVDLRGQGPEVQEDIILDPWAQVMGRVVDEATGDGIPNELMSCGASVTTDADGWFFAAQVQPGTVTCFHIASMCYPSTYQMLEARPGEMANVFFALNRFASLHGEAISGRSDDHVGDAAVSLLPDNKDTVAAADGMFSYECVSPGIRTLVASHPAFSGGATLVLVPDTGAVDTIIRLTPLGEVPSE